MKGTNLLALIFSLTLVPTLVLSLDTIFAKGGTCMYKIRDEYGKCLETQNARLVRDKNNLEPIYTHEKLVDSVNKISCCAYWEFLSCVEEVAEEKCPNEKRDMRAYVRQLGSAVPVEDCTELYPRNSPKCNGSRLADLSVLLMALSLVLLAINHHVVL